MSTVATTATATAFLPFARPAIDAATIAAVGEVLASGWITSGPRVRAPRSSRSAA